MPVANYLEFGSELKIKVDLAYPLNATSEEKKDVEATQVDEVWGLIYTPLYYIYSFIIWRRVFYWELTHS